MNVGQLKKFLEENNIPDHIELYHHEICDCNEEVTVTYYETLDQLEFWVKEKE